MEIKDNRIDEGKAFDWGKTSEYYARFRDIYPEEFYQRLVDRGLCVNGQKVLDIGTGTGVLPRNMYRYGAEWIGTDISPEQIEQAEKLAAESRMNIKFKEVSAEQIDFPDASFDVITACQCFFYFDHKKVAPKFHKVLRKDGRIVILYMAWLPFEDEIAGRSEELVRKFNPKWSGGGETRHPIYIPDVMYEYFNLEDQEVYDLKVPFTKESWHGRMIACRGVGASLSPEDFAGWVTEHRKLLEKLPDRFDVLHYAAISVLKRKEEFPE